MILSYNDCLSTYKTDYKIKKNLQNKELFKIEKGLYSLTKTPSDLEILSYKFPKAILTLNSAFYYYNLTDTIPDKYYLITDKDASKIKDNRVIQIFENYNILYLGATKLEINNSQVAIYNKERLLLELLRYKSKLPYDYYKEVINNYRKIVFELDMQKIQDYLLIIPKSKMIKESLEKEIL